MAIQLHSWPRSSGTRVSWALEELGLPYEYVEVDASKGEQHSARHLSLHPLGKIPALVDGDRTFFESAAILLHLGNTYGTSRGLWPEAGGREHAEALSWTVCGSVEVFGHMMQYLYHGLDTPASYEAKDRSQAAADYSLSQLKRCLDALEARLDKREHMLGDFTLVDIACVSGLLFGTHLGLSLSEYPQVTAWAKRCGARPALQRAR
jgi:glutathione S-transferase